MRTQIFCLMIAVCLGGTSLLRAQEEQAESPKVDAAKMEMAKAWMNYFVGEWDGKSKNWTAESDWEESSSTETVETAAGGMAIVTMSKNSNSEEFVVLSQWDPGANTLVRHGSASIGIAWTAVMTNMTEDSLESELNGFLPDGRKVSGSSKLEKTGARSYKTEWSVSLDGAEFAKSMEEFRRKASNSNNPRIGEAVK